MSAITINAAQYKLLAAVVDTMNAAIEWKAVAEKLNSEDVKKTRDSWYSIRNKLAATLDEGDKPTLDLTPAQKELLNAVIDNKIAGISWDTVASTAGGEDAKKARDAFYPIRKKLNTSSTGEEATGAKAKGKKRKAGEETGSKEAGGGAAPAPAKKAKGKKVKSEEQVGEDTGTVPVKAKAAPKKPAAKKGKKGKKEETPEQVVEADGDDVENAPDLGEDANEDEGDAGPSNYFNDAEQLEQVDSGMPAYY